MKTQKYRTSLTTTAGGAASAVVKTGRGILYKVFYEAGSFDTGVDVTITDTDTGEVLLALTNAGTSNLMKYPRTLQHLNSDGTALTTHDYPLVHGTVTITIAQGGNATTGAIELYIAE